jgi:hypothetical protein
MLKSWCYLLGACAFAFQADAQPTPPREAERSKANTSVSRGPEACGKNPAIYWAGAGPKVQVLRHGTFRMRKALEPEGASTEAVVVEVRIESKKATAYGPSFDQLRRGPASQELEQEVGDRIGWRDGPAGLPPTLVILSDEGSVVVARLQFEGCSTPSARPGGRSRPSTKQAPAPQGNPPASGTPSLTLPQGAIR